MEGHQHQHQHQHHQYGVHIQDAVSAGAVADRFPQWSIQETRDFLMIRAELDPTFMETKRNKVLWEIIATKMREKGYNRSADQCKCKWKNLVTRYKGCETMESEGVRQQFPFYNELQGIFAARMQRMLWMETEGGSKKKGASQISSEEEDDQNEDSEGERTNTTATKKKRKIKGGGTGGTGININPGPGGASASTSNAAGGSHAIVNSLKEILDEFMRQQLQMEMESLKAYEAREEERRKREIEWRQTMETLENERLMMDKRLREREEQRRIREEARAEKRDALITALLNKLRREDL